jgi:hypothetical protein
VDVPVCDPAGTRDAELRDQEGLFGRAREVVQVAGVAVSLPAVVDVVDVFGGLVQQVGIVRVDVVRRERPCPERVGGHERVGVDADRVLVSERLVGVFERIGRHPVDVGRRPLDAVGLRLVCHGPVEPTGQPPLERRRVGRPEVPTFGGVDRPALVRGDRDLRGPLDPEQQPQCRVADVCVVGPARVAGPLGQGRLPVEHVDGPAEFLVDGPRERTGAGRLD